MLVITQVSVTQTCVRRGSGDRGGRHLRVLLVPGERVAGVVEVARERGQLERPEGVAHDRELLRALDADRLLDEAWLWAVREARRVQGDRADVDALAGAELPVDV